MGSFHVLRLCTTSHVIAYPHILGVDMCIEISYLAITCRAESLFTFYL